MESIKDSKLGKSLWRIKEYSLFKFFLITVSPSFILVIQNWRSLPYPSLSYDEVFWVSTSLKTSPELYSVYKLFGQNLFLTNYAGSTKGIFYSIIFQFIEPSIYVVRISSIILAGLGISFLYFAVSRFSHSVAITSSAILVLNPLIGMHAKYDLGLSSTGFTINCIFIGLMICYLNSGKKIYLGLAMLTSVFGIWNKLIFIWQFNALLIFFVFLLFLKRFSPSPDTRTNIAALCSKSTIKIISICGVANYALYFLIYFGLNVEGTFKFNLELISLKLKYLWFSLSGTSYIISAWDFRPEIFSILLSSLNCLILFYAVIPTLYVLISKTPNIHTFKDQIQVLMLFTSGFFVLIQILLVQNADKPWHLLSLYPQITLLEALGLVSLFKNKGIRSKISSLIIIVGIVVFSLIVSLKVQDSVKRPAQDSTSWTRLWSTSATSDFLTWAPNQSKRLLLFDWGFQTQLLLLDSKKLDKYIDLHWEILTNNKVDLNAIKSDDLIVTHSQEASAFPKVRELLFDTLAKQSVRLCTLRKFSDKDGLVVIEVWRVCK